MLNALETLFFLAIEYKSTSFYSQSVTQFVKIQS